jgi:hypothetical protein
MQNIGEDANKVSRRRSQRLNACISALTLRLAGGKLFAAVSQPDIDKRRFKRTRVEVRVLWIEGAGTTVRGAHGQACDFSEGGISVVLPAIIKNGQPCDLYFSLPHNSVPVRVPAVVRNSVGDRYGFEFTELGSAEIEEIRRACEILTPASLEPASGQ